MNEFKKIDLFELSGVNWSKIIYRVTTGYGKWNTFEGHSFSIKKDYGDFYNQVRDVQTLIDSVRGHINYGMKMRKCQFKFYSPVIKLREQSIRIPEELVRGRPEHGLRIF